MYRVEWWVGSPVVTSRVVSPMPLTVGEGKEAEGARSDNVCYQTVGDAVTADERKTPEQRTRYESGGCKLVWAPALAPGKTYRVKSKGSELTSYDRGADRGSHRGVMGGGGGGVPVGFGGEGELVSDRGRDRGAGGDLRCPECGLDWVRSGGRGWVCPYCGVVWSLEDHRSYRPCLIRLVGSRGEEIPPLSVLSASESVSVN